MVALIFQIEFETERERRLPLQLCGQRLSQVISGRAIGLIADLWSLLRACSLPDLLD